MKELDYADIKEKILYYTDGKVNFAILTHGTVMMDGTLTPVDELVERVIKNMGDQDKFKPYPMDDDDYLIVFQGAACMVVPGEEIRECCHGDYEKMDIDLVNKHAMPVYKKYGIYFHADMKDPVIVVRHEIEKEKNANSITLLR